MRQITKYQEPQALTRWTNKHRDDPNFGYDLLRSDQVAIDAVEASLLEEQRGLCAYTGLRIGRNGMHVEHRFPQKADHTQPLTPDDRRESVEYQNLFACHPAPNAGHPGFGALQKGNWPARQERHRFVHPLLDGCGRRFRFNRDGTVVPKSLGDDAARETIDRLGLNHRILVEMRKSAISKTVRNRANSDLRRRLRELRQQEMGTGPLDQFSFVLIRFLEEPIAPAS